MSARAEYSTLALGDCRTRFERTVGGMVSAIVPTEQGFVKVISAGTDSVFDIILGGRCHRMIVAGKAYTQRGIVLEARSFARLRAASVRGGAR